MKDSQIFIMSQNHFSKIEIVSWKDVRACVFGFSWTIQLSLSMFSNYFQQKWQSKQRTWIDLWSKNPMLTKHTLKIQWSCCNLSLFVNATRMARNSNPCIMGWVVSRWHKIKWPETLTSPNCCHQQNHKLLHLQPRPRTACHLESTIKNYNFATRAITGFANTYSPASKRMLYVIIIRGHKVVMLRNQEMNKQMQLGVNQTEYERFSQNNKKNLTAYIRGTSRKAVNSEPKNSTHCVQ